MHSIGDFAERLINEQVGNIREGKQLPPTHSVGSVPAGRDVSKVTVPDAFMKEILGESFNPQDTPTTDSIPELVWSDSEEPEAPPQNPQVLTEETAQQLGPLLEEVRDLLKEMTTAGMMGVNMGETTKDNESWEKMEKSYGYKSSKPSKLPGDSRKKVLKNAISAKLRKRK